MPFDTACPECSARLRLDAPPPAGHPVECPKCGALFVPPKAKKRPADEDDTPRLKKKEKAAGEKRVMPHETSLEIKRIIETLPHRYPFLMIDRVIEFIGEDEMVAIKNVTINEPYFQGHFPGEPVMPGVLQIEAMAQAAGILMLRKTSSEGKTAFFMSADKVKFRKAVRPGDQLVINAKLTKNRGNRIGVAECTCTVGGTVVSSGELMFSVMDSAGEVS